MIPLRVTAHTPAGFSSNDPWSPSLDGLLAYWHLREQLGEEEFALGATGHHRVLVTPDDLPLARESHGDQWWWVCSSPVYTTLAEHRRWFHRRFDIDQAIRFAHYERTGRVGVSSGPYKNYRLARTVHVTPQVTWHCVGDPAEIRRLLRRCWAIGANTGQGLGRVTAWEVTERDADEYLARTFRPLPAEYAVLQGIDGPLLEWGIRPPGRLLENKTLCVMPEPG